MEILMGRFIIYDGKPVSHPGTIIIDSEADEPEILELKMRLGEKRSLSLGGIPNGTEFMFEADDGERYMDEWTHTPGTRHSQSFPLLLVGAPPEDHPEFTETKRERLQKKLAEYYEAAAQSAAAIDNEFWYTEQEMAQITAHCDEVHGEILTEFG